MLFDNERAVKTAAASNLHPASFMSPNPPYQEHNNSLRMTDPLELQSPNLIKSTHSLTPLHISPNINDNPHQIVGDVSEPLWVQSTREGALWSDPDDLFMLEAKRFVTVTDKRFFWEMARALIDFPEISLACKTGIRTANDLTTALKRPEFRILWSPEAAEYLTKDMSVDLIKAAYCPVANNEKP